MAIFQGCHGNREGCRAEIWYVDRSCSAERTIICLNALAQILPEIWPKNGFSCFYSDFSRKKFHSLQFSELRHETGCDRKLMTLRRESKRGFLNFDLGPEKMAPKVATVGQK